MCSICCLWATKHSYCVLLDFLMKCFSFSGLSSNSEFTKCQKKKKENGSMSFFTWWHTTCATGRQQIGFSLFTQCWVKTYVEKVQKEHFWWNPDAVRQNIFLYFLWSRHKACDLGKDFSFLTLSVFYLLWFWQFLASENFFHNFPMAVVVHYTAEKCSCIWV